MIKTSIAIALLAAAVAARADFLPANEYFVGVDARQTVPSGDYAGLVNPNYNRLTFLYGHQYDGSGAAAPSTSHFHAKTVLGYFGPAASPTVVNPTGNFLPETTGLSLQLLPGSGGFAGRYVSGGTPDAPFANLTVRPVSWLNRPGAAAWETATFNSGGTTPVGRWTGSLGASSLALEIVGLTSGLSLLNPNGSVAADAAGQSLALGSGDFATSLIFGVDGAAPVGSAYTAQFRLRDLSGAFGDSGVFEYRLQTAPAPVPEPATLAVVGLGAFGLLRRRKRA